jgi:hypothetical protein
MSFFFTTITHTCEIPRIQNKIDEIDGIKASISLPKIAEARIWCNPIHVYCILKISEAWMSRKENKKNHKEA